MDTDQGTCKDSPNLNYRYVYPELWLHARHQETQRLMFTNIYALIITGLLVYLGNLGDKIIETQSIILLCLLIILSIGGLLLTDAWNKSFAYYRTLIRGITIVWQVPPDPYYHHERFPAWKIFLLFYSFTTSFFGVSIIYVVAKYLGFASSPYFFLLVPVMIVFAIILYYERLISSDKFFQKIKKNIEESLNVSLDAVKSIQ
jgi:hypothetical protein